MAWWDSVSAIAPGPNYAISVPFDDLLDRSRDSCVRHNNLSQRGGVDWTWSDGRVRTVGVANDSVPVIMDVVGLCMVLVQEE